MLSCDLVAGSHSGRRQNSRHWNNACLLNDGQHCVSPFAAQPLIERCGAGRRSVALHLDHVSRGICSRLHKFRELLLILLVDRCFSIGEVDGYAVLGFVLVQRTEPLICMADSLRVSCCGFVGCSKPLLGGVDILRVLCNVLLVLVDVLAIALELILRSRNFFVDRIQTCINLLCNVQRIPRERDFFCKQLVIGVISTLNLYRQAGNQGSDAEVFSIQTKESSLFCCLCAVR